MPALTWADYGIIGIIGLSGLIGLIRGLIREVFSLVAWGAAVWIGLHYSQALSAHLEQVVALPSARALLAFAILFVASLILAGMLAYLLGKLVESTGLTGTDRLAGLIFGIARGTLIMAVLVLLAGATPLPSDPWWRESKLIPPFQSLALWLRTQIPSDYYASRLKSSIESRR